jgi:hypothetical protein
MKTSALPHVLALALSSASSYAATIVVDTTSPLANAFVTACTSAPGDCSFHGALLAAETSVGPDTIEFNIPATTDPNCVASTGVCEVALPVTAVTVTSDLVIDGYTQSGSAPNTLSADNQGLNTSIKILLSRSTTNNTNRVFATGSLTLRGVHLTNAGYTSPAFLIEPSGNQQVILEGNYIGGTNATEGKNITVGCGQGSASVRIGGLLPAQRNWILGGAPAFDVRVCQANQTLTVQGNLFSTTKNGMSHLVTPRTSLMLGTSNGATALIGGTQPGARNVFNSSVGPQIIQQAVGANSLATVQGNYFGFAVDGLTSLNEPPNTQAGVYTFDMRRALIGGIGPGEGNRIRGPLQDGVAVDPDGINFLGNTVNGVRAARIIAPRTGSTISHPARVTINSFAPSAGMVNFNYQVMSSTAQTNYPLTVEFFKTPMNSNNPAIFLGRDVYQAAEATLPKAVNFALPATVSLNSDDVVVAVAAAANNQGSGEFSHYLSQLSFVGNNDGFADQTVRLKVLMQSLGPFRPRGSVIIADTLLTNPGVQTCVATLTPSAMGQNFAEGECDLFMRFSAGSVATLTASLQTWPFDVFFGENYSQVTATRTINVVAAPANDIFCDGFETPARCARTPLFR